MQMLIVKQPEGDLRVFDLYGEDISIGRDRVQDMQLAHQSVSREHARMTWDHGSYGIDDNNSHNGVYVNGSRIDRRCDLTNGDVVQIGHFELIYIDGKPPRRFSEIDIHSLKRWFPLSAETQDNSTRHLSTSQMQRLLSARRLLEHACLISDGGSAIDLGEQEWRLGRKGNIPLKGWQLDPVVAEVQWNGHNHVLVQVGRFHRFTVNGQSIRSCTLEPSDTIRIGKQTFTYEVSE